LAQGKRKLFDENIALNAAMNVFWQKGYVGTSLADLTHAMGINKPSMYSTFGNKEALFVKAAQSYIDSRMYPNFEGIQEQHVPLKQRLKANMMAIVDNQSELEHAKGCLLVLGQSELIGGNIPPQAALILEAADKLGHQLYANLFTTDKEAISLGLDVNAHANALAIYTLLKGTAAMTRAGITKEQLEYSIDTMLNGLGLA